MGQTFYIILRKATAEKQLLRYQKSNVFLIERSCHNAFHYFAETGHRQVQVSFPHHLFQIGVAAFHQRKGHLRIELSKFCAKGRHDFPLPHKSCTDTKSASLIISHIGKGTAKLSFLIRQAEGIFIENPPAIGQLQRHMAKEKGHAPFLFQ